MTNLNPVDAMTNPYRDCLAKLADKIDFTWGDIPADVEDLLCRARALLAQPVAKRPTDEEMTLTYAYAVAAAVDNKRGQFTTEDIEAAQLAGLRAVLAKWGHSTPQPEPAPVAVSERLPGPEATVHD
jgi:hypothetical protein